MPRNLPPLNAIRAFEAVARHEHLGDAAAELSVTHSALSQQVKHLENWFGTELFTREKGRLYLKPESRDLVDGYTRAFDLLQQTTDLMSAESGSNNLVIQCEPAFFSKVLIHHMSVLREVAGNVSIDIVTARSPARHFPEDVDIAIHFSAHPEWKDLTIEHLVDISGFPACSPDFQKRHCDIHIPHDLVEVPLLHGDDRASWALWLRKYANANPMGCTNIYFDDFTMTIQAAVMGDGAIMADPVLCKTELESGALIPLFEQTVHEVSYHAFCPNSKIKKRVVQKVFDALVHEMHAATGFKES